MSTPVDSAPPVPSESPPPYEEVPVAPPPLVNERGRLGSNTVTHNECIVHLKFLGALADLREVVSCADGLCGVYDSMADSFPNRIGEARARIQEKRWAVYTARAVDRFIIWWDKCVPKEANLPTLKSLESGECGIAMMKQEPLAWSRDDMPPLDILMVLHAFMLNPRSFLEDCLRQGRLNCWKAGFPWDIFTACFHDPSLSYDPGKVAMARFQYATGLNWDNLEDAQVKNLVCPVCSRHVTVPWTTADMNSGLDKAFEHCTGYADKSFETRCRSCKFHFTHDRLKVVKFRVDFEDLLDLKLPLPGTLFDLQGFVPASTKKNIRPELYPNHLANVIRDDLLRVTRPDSLRCSTIGALRSVIERRLAVRHVVERANESSHSSFKDPKSRIALRRMMSRYWDNNSPFSLDLVGAVIRQGSFIQKMDTFDWLHSPSLLNTIDYSIWKYEVFFDIMARNPTKAAVPTLDVDLAWHTHQLAPSRYYKYSTMTIGGVFVDHDDKIDENALSDGFDWTSAQFLKLTNRPYSDCLCWYCQAIRAPSLRDKLSVSSSPENDANLNISDRTIGPHISAHGAIRTQGAKKGPEYRQLMLSRLKSRYDAASRRGGKQQEQNRQLSPNEISGGDLPVPVARMLEGLDEDAPYMCNPTIHSDAYVHNPACMNVTSGAAGNCISGTCGGGVAAGSCGGMGSAGCVGTTKVGGNGAGPKRGSLFCISMIGCGYRGGFMGMMGSGCSS